MAEDAAVKAVEKTLILHKGNSDSGAGDDINLNAKMKQIFYDKMSKPSLGDMIANQIDSNLANKFVEKLIPGMFGASVQSHEGKGVLGFVTDLLNTQFAYGAGQTMGASAADIIKTIGQERVGSLIDKYTGKKGETSQSQQQLNPEQQQKKNESIIMGLDSSNETDVLNFMKAVGINDFVTAKNTLLFEQDRILQSRGLNRQDSVKTSQEKSPEKQDNKKDINRNLIDQYENSGQQNTGNANKFFDSSSNVQSKPFGINSQSSQVSENEFILSLNPDDPISQQQYMAYRGITGVSLDEIKRLMIKEQKKFRTSNPESQSQEIKDAQIIEDNNKLQQKQPISEADKQPISEADKQPISEADKQPISEADKQPISEADKIVDILNIFRQNIESNIKELNNKIGILENEIIELKKPKVDEVEKDKSEIIKSEGILNENNKFHNEINEQNTEQSIQGNNLIDLNSEVPQEAKNESMLQVIDLPQKGRGIFRKKHEVVQEKSEDKIKSDEIIGEI